MTSCSAGVKGPSLAGLSLELPSCQYREAPPCGSAQDKIIFEPNLTRVLLDCVHSAWPGRELRLPVPGG
jgi:hypothetical protein